VCLVKSLQKKDSSSSPHYGENVTEENSAVKRGRETPNTHRTAVIAGTAGITYQIGRKIIKKKGSCASAATFCKITDPSSA
jgi:hypothetical protein